MALAQYSELFWFPSGSVAASVPARVFQHSTNTLATLYADAGGTTPLANPTTTSGTGRLEFWVEEGQYWVHIDSEAFEIAVGTAAQPATQQDILDEITRADAAYAPILHAARHAAAGADPVTLAQSQITGLATALAALLPLAGGTVTGELTVDNNLNVTNSLEVANSLEVGGDVTVIGDSQFNGDIVVQGAGKAYRFRRGGSALDLEATGVDLLISNWSGTAFNGSQRAYFRLSADAQNVQVAGKVEFAAALYGAVQHVLDGATNTAGFFGAAPVGRQAVTGSRGGNAALASLLTALDTLGLIDDQTTA